MKTQFKTHQLNFEKMVKESMKLLHQSEGRPENSAYGDLKKKTKDRHY